MNNEAMVKRWCPDVDGYDKKQYQKTGDGHIMAIDAGAKMENLGHTKMMHDFDSGLMYEEPFLYVNMEGKRFCNEDTGFVYMGNITKYLPATMVPTWMPTTRTALWAGTARSTTATT